ncbi:MAG: RagB/SusD family nutrient uptake outer membrane protein [Prevotella sp.]|nr:RagB/SusD family nutrient uptake outer membrane protein [Prevotella sp.]MBR1464616.1 RagB/SusD family nutrient uptake outer membrane protein [Prevotella sp.]
MIKMRYKDLAAGALSIFLAFSSLAFTSCDDMLDIRGENIQKEQDQFETYKGFRDALTGCYMQMGSTDIYGMNLTMTNIENMACLWYTRTEYRSTTGVQERYYLTHHDYANDYAKTAIQSTYKALFTTISSANLILKNIQEKGSNIADAKMRAVIEGEAYAIRAYCQFDVLRIFGQLPQGGTRNVSLPYSDMTSIDAYPSYFGFSEYVARLMSDIQNAENLLRDNDPIFSSTFEDLNNPYLVMDDFGYYRQSRLNYWAVRALHARIDLYLGNTSEAHQIAMEIINAKGSDGNPLVELSGTSDLQNGYNGLPNECLFYLSKYDLNDYANVTMVGGRSDSRAYAGARMCYLSADMFNELYASLPGATASHNRYLNWWNRTIRDSFGAVAPTLKKYWYDEDHANSDDLLTKHQIIPMIRLSELYLMAIETSSSVEEANSLYATYMKSCDFSLFTPFTSLEEARAEMMNEIRREFIGEGHMFYTYKRTNASSMMWSEDEITEDNYIVPLPSTEYDSNK